MIVARDYKSFIEARSKLNGSVGFVPTMGALHEGHLSLIKKSISQNSATVVSVFVNPTQFLAGEDLNKYPRPESADIKICELAKVDILYMPTIEQMYNSDELKISAPKIRGYILEGANRPGHFDGVLQVVMKLLNIVKPTNAYFGKKDVQQLILIEQMVKDYFIDTNIVACDIVREPDGLAMSSRNIYLNPNQRIRALSISKALKRGVKMVQSGIYDTNQIKDTIKDLIEPEVDSIEYIAITDRRLKEINSIKLDDTIILIAVKIGSTRLIDNIWI